MNKKLPNIGDVVKTADGRTGEVQRVNILRQNVKLIVVDDNGDKEIVEYKLDDLNYHPKGGRKRRGKGNQKNYEN